jgi:hypothetical protein
VSAAYAALSSYLSLLEAIDIFTRESLNAIASSLLAPIATIVLGLYYRSAAERLRPCQDLWHFAWHFSWCAAVSRGDSWRITSHDAFEFSEEFAGSHEKAGHDSAGF